MALLDLSRPANLPAPKPNLTGMTRAELAAAFVAAGACEHGKAKMRASQVWRWMHNAGVTDFDRMTDVAKDTRARLADTFMVERPQVVERQVSSDGTRKYLIRTAPGVEVETVYIPDVGRSGALC